jgi:hypothetical protein
MPQFDTSASSLPVGAVQVSNASGMVANASAVATLSTVPGKTTYLTNLIVSGLGATTGTVADLAISGIQGGTLTLSIPVPTGPGVATSAVIPFAFPLRANALNTPIVITLGAFGSGNAAAAVAAIGYHV